MDEHHAMRLLRDHPEISFGVHLTVVCDTDGYGWGPLAPRERVPSLVDGAGFFPPPKGIPELLARAELDELELEFRTQIDAVLSPTHLDWHCLENGGRADVFDMTCRLAREHGLAVRADYGPWTSGLRQRGLPVADSFGLEVDDKPAAYVRLLSDLPPGLNLWAVHPGVGDPELQAAEPDGWRGARDGPRVPGLRTGSRPHPPDGHRAARPRIPAAGVAERSALNAPAARSSPEICCPCSSWHVASAPT